MQIEILKAKNKQCYVVYKAKNGRILAVTETFKQLASAKKNIKAMLKLFKGMLVGVADKTGKIESKILIEN